MTPSSNDHSIGWSNLVMLNNMGENMTYLQNKFNYAANLRNVPFFYVAKYNSHWNLAFAIENIYSINPMTIRTF